MHHREYQYCIDKVFKKYQYLKKLESLQNNGFSEYALDTASLQLRKMVEYILLGVTLIHNDAIVKSQHYWETRCGGRSLFNGVMDINNSFFPTSGSDGKVLSRQKLLNLFEVSSHIIHIINPFLPRTQKHIDSRIKKTFAMAHEMAEVLTNHSIMLYNGDKIIYKRLSELKSTIQKEDLIVQGNRKNLLAISDHKTPSSLPSD